MLKMSSTSMVHRSALIRALRAACVGLMAALVVTVPDSAHAVAISGTTVTGTTNGGTSIVLTSWTPAAYELILVSVHRVDDAATVSVSGNGITFTLVNSVCSAGYDCTDLYRGMSASPTTGSITVTLTGNTGEAIAKATRFSSVDITGTNGSGAVEANTTSSGNTNDLVDSLATLTNNAWLFGAGSDPSDTLTLTSPETAININQLGPAGVLYGHTWYETVATAGTTQLGDLNNLSTNARWTLILASIKPGNADAPSATFGTLPATPSSGTIRINYNIIEPNSEVCDISQSATSGIEYSIDSTDGVNGTWNDCTQGTGGDGMTGLASSPSGTAHVFAWNSATDLPNIEDSTVYIRVRPGDTRDGTAWYPSGSFGIDNKNPVQATQVAFVTPPASGDTSVQLDVAYTDLYPNLNWYAYRLNGGAYVWGQGTSNVQDPPAYSFSVTVDGSDYFTAIYSSHTDDMGNVGTSAGAAMFVRPKVPNAPTIDANPPYDRMNVTVVPNPTEGGTNLYYAIKATDSVSGTRYVQADGTLNTNPVWRNNWTSPTLVTGLVEARQYSFSVAAGNSQDPSPSVGENSASSTGTATTATTNTRPTVAITPLAALTSGQITISYTLTDANSDTCNISQTATSGIEYSNDNSTWFDCTMGAGGDGLTGLAASPGGTAHTFVWNSAADLSTLPNGEDSTVYVRIRPNDGKNDATAWTGSAAFGLDNVNPRVSLVTHFEVEPKSGDTSIQLDAAFTELNPNTNWFSYNLNGAGYSSWSAGGTNTADPAPLSIGLAALNGDDYFTAIRSSHTDDLGLQVGSEYSTVRYVSPRPPLIPTLANVTDYSVQITVNPDPSETASGVYYVIRATSAAGGTQYVDANGKLGSSPVWKTAWASPQLVDGLNPSTPYWFSVSAGNALDGTPSVAENSQSAFGPSATVTTAALSVYRMWIDGGTTMDTVNVQQ